MFRNNPKLFQDPKINYPIYDLSVNFDDYIQQTKKIISETRQDLASNADLIINANTPFELRPDGKKPTRGVLLVHGLIDSPFVMRDMGEHFRAQGFLVRAILLPGHGTVPGALLNTTREEWLQSLRYGIATLQKEVDEIYIAGYSTGASLAMQYAANENTPIAGIILVAPAIKLCSKFACIAHLPKLISWAWSRANWFYIGEELDYTRYSSMTYNSIYQVYQLTREVRGINPKKFANIPIMMILSLEDSVVSSKASLIYFKQTTHAENKVLLYSSRVFQAHDARVIPRNGRFPDLGIDSISHIALPNAPDNPHYGKNGDYPLASHIDVSRFAYGSESRFEEQIREAFYKLGLTKILLSRLTFMPDFEYMTYEIEKFIRVC